MSLRANASERSNLPMNRRCLTIEEIASATLHSPRNDTWNSAFTRLDTPQAGIDAAGCDQLIVAALLDQLTALEDEDAVGVADGGQAVGDDDGGAANGDLFERALDEGFGLVVDRGGGFVEDEDGRVFEDGPRNRDTR